MQFDNTVWTLKVLTPTIFFSGVDERTDVEDFTDSLLPLPCQQHIFPLIVYVLQKRQWTIASYTHNIFSQLGIVIGVIIRDYSYCSSSYENTLNGELQCKLTKQCGP